MRRVPWTVTAFVVWVALVLGSLLIAGGDRQELLYSPLLIVPTVGLVYGFWPAWAFLTFIAAGDIVQGLTDGDAATILINGTMLALLAAPPTWRHASRARPRLRRG